ncbi:hypothetical protein [Roseateles puraquae]|nr:hypothetical protein [Roseateles puraquae]MDG0853566.1 hypothetical protein [Roseateles puraquae]
MSASWPTTDYPLQQLFAPGSLTPTRMLSRLKLPPEQEMQLRLLCIRIRSGEKVLSSGICGAFGRSAWQVLYGMQGMALRVVDLPVDVGAVRDDARLDLMDAAREELELSLPLALLGLLTALVRNADAADRADVEEYARAHGYYRP